MHSFTRKSVPLGLSALIALALAIPTVNAQNNGRRGPPDKPDKPLPEGTCEGSNYVNGNHFSIPSGISALQTYASFSRCNLPNYPERVWPALITQRAGIYVANISCSTPPESIVDQPPYSFPPIDIYWAMTNNYHSSEMTATGYTLKTNEDGSVLVEVTGDITYGFEAGKKITYEITLWHSTPEEYCQDYPYSIQYQSGPAKLTIHE